MAFTTLYLIDKSAWEQRRYAPAARERIAELRASGQLAICVITMAELLYSSRNAAELGDDHKRLGELRFLSITAAAEEQVVSIMKALAAAGKHRRPIPDIVIAAIARVHRAVVLHYDHDFEVIADATGLQHEWIIPRGTGHSRGQETG